MSRTVHTCDTRDTLVRAAQIMWDHDCGSVPVVDGHNRLVGIITDRDCAMAAYLKGKALSEIRVVDVTSHSLSACEPKTSLELALQTMRHNAVRRLPVVDHNGCLVGIITLGDLAQASLSAADTTPGRRGSKPQAVQVGDTLAAICEHQRRAAPSY